VTAPVIPVAPRLHVDVILPDSLARRLELAAAHTGITRAALTRAILSHHLPEEPT
jgi:predicted DNA-binding protein